MKTATANRFAPPSSPDRRPSGVTSRLLLLGLVTLLCSACGRAQLLQPEVLFSFPRGPAQPHGNLVQGSDGSLYGTTYGGGTSDGGTVFKVTTNGIVSTLVSFVGTNGASPDAGLTLGIDGFLYGTTSSGGTNSNCYCGTVFRMATDGTLTTLVSFGGPNGISPRGRLLVGSDGDFYGTTFEDGGIGYGTVFKMTTNGTLTTLASFQGTNGAYPTGGLVQGPNGHFYGTTGSGGASNLGTIFRVTTNGALTRLVSFSGANGASPWAGLTLGNDGNLYGTTAVGGANNAGTVFRVSPSGLLTRLFSFTEADGAYPQAGLTLGLDGKLYGSTAGGNVAGTVFRVTTNGTLNVLVTFTGTNGSGRNPGGLTLGSDGNFVGATEWGGSANRGTVFHVTTNGVLTTLVSLSDSKGRSPNSLTLASDGSLYGTTTLGGSHDQGTIFRLTPDGAVTTLVSFTGDNGSGPNRLVRGSDGSFYGTTYNGGSDYDGTVGIAGFGTVFKLSTNGTLTTLASFHGMNGLNPIGGLVEGRDGNFYGTANDWNYGMVFRVTPDGLLTPLHSFTDFADGSQPNGLALGDDGNLYGTTYHGGGNSVGTVFRMTMTGVWTKLFASFLSLNGAFPQGGLAVGPDGSFYGTTASGGGFGTGTLFKAGTNGAVTPLASFPCCEGVGFGGGKSLIAGNDGNLYGTTEILGTGNGTLFQATTTGELSTLVAFDGTNGLHPNSLAVGNDGSLYGTTSGGGSEGLGAIFRVRFPDAAPVIVVQPAGQTNLYGTVTTLFVTAFGAGPLSYFWRKNGLPLNDGGNISGAFTRSLTLSNVTATEEGLYSVIVSNHLDVVESSGATLAVLGTAPLSESLDATNLEWRITSGLFGQTDTAHDGVDAAQTFLLPGPARPDSWLRTAVTNTSTLSFWWKMSPGNDFEQFALLWDSVLLAAISGNTDWQHVTLVVHPGWLDWRYRYGFPEAGTGWLDQIELLPIAPPTISAYERLADGQFRFRFDAAPGQTFGFLVSTNLTDWTLIPIPPTEIGPGQFEFTDAEAPNHPTRFYRVQAQ